MVIVLCSIARCIIFGVPRLPVRPCDERPPAMYGHFCLVPRVSVHDRYYCIYFCITAWGFKCNRIFTLQKKGLRIITKSKLKSHTEPLFRELSMLKVEHIFQIQCLQLYYNVINERTPNFFLENV